ncbi:MULTISPECIES: Fur family transcriptional regulator [Salegentibacter]|uniref:Fur family transcriptional regulator, ferric uptake regulator n=1 Tax=Salegentibacter agarivorans TaxID=345907 RepID=A0A1I2NBN5_9FLAO|nr:MULTISPECIES: transcriptional repressor [Salegentibacter]SFF98781.1 Fur family transcriptional regulator, ferric uptake regulator [Salegentibacter agarivorans]
MDKATVNKLLNRSTKPTSMRILVYDFLVTQNVALSLSEIEEQLFTADRITIYRTLKTFEEKGIVHSIQENTTTKYVLCDDECSEITHKDWHLHFYCKICKQTTCRENILLPSQIGGDFRIDEIRFFAKGICENCLDESLQ